MKAPFSYISIFIICALLCWLGVKSCTQNNNEQKITQLQPTDTFYVKQPYKVEVLKEVEKPVKIYIYRTDTVLREKIEHADLILKVEYKRNFLYKDLSFLKVDKISKQGVITSNYYNAANAKGIKIFADGKTEVQKRKFIIPKILVGVTAGTILAYTGIKAYNEIK